MGRLKKKINQNGQIKITENHVKKSVKDLLNLKKIYNFPILQGMGCHPGIADIMAVGHKRCPHCGYSPAIAIECKTQTGRQSPDQIIFEQNWVRSGAIYILARGPEDVVAGLDLPVLF